MPTRIDRAMRYMKRQLDRTAAVTVTLVDGDETNNAISAVPVTANFAEYAAGEFVSTAQRFDWIVQASTLTFGGEKREPSDKWELWHLLEDGRTAVYKLFAGENGRCFEVEDALGILYCLHTKLDRIIDAEAT